MLYVQGTFLPNLLLKQVHGTQQDLTRLVCDICRTFQGWVAAIRRAGEQSNGYRQRLSGRHTLSKVFRQSVALYDRNPLRHREYNLSDGG